VSKTLPTLAADNAIERDSKGNVTATNRQQLLTRWTVDYQVLKSNSTPGYFVAPRGLDNVLTKLAGMSGVAVTGTKAAQAWLPQDIAPIMPVTQLVAYSANPGRLADVLGLVPVEPSVANMIILPPKTLPS
jgi:hypothetical protein